MSITMKRDGIVLWRGQPIGRMEYVFTANPDALGTLRLTSTNKPALYQVLQRKLVSDEQEARERDQQTAKAFASSQKGGLRHEDDHQG